MLGLLILIGGIWQLFIARKMYLNIKKNVKNPIPYVFVGVYISMAMGIALIIIGAIGMFR